MTLSAELDKINAEIEQAISLLVIKFFADLQRQAPVDTGTFRSAWKIKRTNRLEWEITNNMMYASILWDGRRMIGKSFKGSEQWPGGGEPMLLALNREIKLATDKIKR